MPHGAAHDPAQHVAAALVGGEHAVGDQERRGAQVIGNHTVRDRVRAFRLGAGGLGGGMDQRLQEIDPVVVVRALHDGGNALQAHAGIDRRLRQVDALVRRDLLVLHEDEVPDLDEAVAIGIRTAGRAAWNVRPVVVEDLRAGAAGSGLTHRPEIVRAGNADDAVVRQAGNLLPQRMRNVVFGVDGDEQAVGGKTELLGDERPGQLDGEILEIIAEGEVAQHLEERVMPRGVADVLQVVVLAAGPYALLRCCRARVITALDAGKDVLELDHAGVGEQQRGIVPRHERARGHGAVAMAGKEVEERLADVVDGLHGPAGQPLSITAGPTSAPTLPLLAPAGAGVQASRTEAERSGGPDASGAAGRQEGAGPRGAGALKRRRHPPHPHSSSARRRRRGRRWRGSSVRSRRPSRHAA